MSGTASVPRRRDATVRGACPSVHHPFDEKDGALVRVRVPAGSMSAAQVDRLAGAAAQAQATFEITSRANLQIRGLAPGAVARLVSAIVDAGLALADPPAESQVDVMVGPMAGADPTELVDTRPVARHISELLAAEPAAGLPPKFGVVVDGAGASHLRGRPHDLALGAVLPPDGVLRYEVAVGHGLPLGGTPRDGEPLPTIAIDDAGRIVQAAVRLAATEGCRLSELADADGPLETVNRIAAGAGVTVETLDPSGLQLPSAPASAPIGQWPQRRPERATVGAMPELGRLDPLALAGLGRLSANLARGEVRLTPWRSVLVPDVEERAAQPMLDALSTLGFACEPDDPALGVVACAGSSGCSSGLADTQADGRRLIALLRSAPPTRPLAVHLSGCPKRCAGRQGHDLTLLAGPADGTYEVYRRAPGPRGSAAGDAGTAGAEQGGGPDPSLGTLLRTGLDAGSALAAVLSACHGGAGR